MMQPSVTAVNPIFQKINALNEADIPLLEFLSFIFHPISQERLITTFNSYARKVCQKPVTGFGPVNRLLKSGLVEHGPGGVRCGREFVEDISAHAVMEGRALGMCRTLESEAALLGHSFLSFVQTRLSLYLGDPDPIERAFVYGRQLGRLLTSHPAEVDFEDHFRELLKGMSTGAPLQVFPPDFAAHLLYSTLFDSLEWAKDSEKIYHLLEQTESPKRVKGIHPGLFLCYLARGEEKKIEESLKLYPAPDLLLCRAAYLGEEPDPKLELTYASSTTELPFYKFLFMLGSLRTEDWHGVRSCIDRAQGWEREILSLLFELAEGDPEERLLNLWEHLIESDVPPLFLFQGACCLYWGGYRGELQELDLEAAAARYEKAGYLFLVKQLLALHRIGIGEGEPTAFLRQITCKEPWERLVDGLLRFSELPARRKQETPAHRLVWNVDLERAHPVQVKVQKWGKREAWTSGRQIGLQELGKYYPHQMDAHDREVYEKLLAADGGSLQRVGRLLLKLVGHPRLFDPDERPVRLVRGKPLIELLGNDEQVTLHTSVIRAHGIAYRKLGPTEFELMELDERLEGLFELIARHQGVAMPSDQISVVSRALLRASQEELQIASNLSTVALGEEVPGDSTLVLRLTPEGEGLRCRVLVQPAGQVGPVYPPGRGEPYLSLEENGVPLTYCRDLKKEKSAWRKLRRSTPHLTGQEQVLEDPRHCLELLESLGGRDGVRLEWPQGARFRIKGRYEWKQFGLSVRRDNDWLEVQGELEISKTERWELTRLLQELRDQNSRFIPLGGGEFLALTEEFHRRLDALRRASKKQATDRLQLDPLSGSILLEDGLVEGDSFWHELRERVERARTLKPVVPPTVRAELRPYQTEGFEWLARAAARGVGCCLADDMGLGKTLQALTLLSHRFSNGEGPSLIVAPTSVCYNWAEEMERFTPDLAPVLFSQADDRESVFRNLSRNQVVITSYGLLVNEVEMFQQVEWANIVLDEAQAIKNPTTRRFKAAISLRGDFRMATTGTPIENRIDEIWALFRFLNPGLLGSRKSFDQTYSGLEEMEEKRESLRMLLSPFILRRLKSQVLRELPPRTDVNLTVELSKEEKLHYESLRLHALERLEESRENDAISILTELTRLRRACCHPRLVTPKSKLEGSKLKVLLRLLDDLKASGHRVLVFSQFVDHLKLVEKEVKKRGYAHLYLDGSTPAKMRGRLVERFQNGEGDLFLISLMAGGTGLNLTAANYVVHLDPWWNPAVEDQASDRAHRIGQDQPVTVYRLITKGTIEEKILKLHDEKRELADSLLRGTDKASKLSAAELMNLLRDKLSTQRA